jgi:hypothetical protein
VTTSFRASQTSVATDLGMDKVKTQNSGNARGFQFGIALAEIAFMVCLALLKPI